jgi:alpha-methylacyl-CoA racemase
VRADFRAAFARRTRDEWVAELGPADTCVSEVASVPELVGAAQFRERHVFTQATAPGTGDFEQVGWVLAGMDRDQPGPAVRAATVTDTDALLREVGYSAAEIAALREKGIAA